MDGTVYLGDRLLPGAKEFLAYLEAHKIPFYFITNNSSQTRSQYTAKLNQLGIFVDDEQIFTSGEATALYLKRKNPGARLFVVGTPSLEEEFQTCGFTLVEDIPDFVVLGFDTTLTYKKIQKLCDFVRAGVCFIATHPDINCPTETGFMPDIGSMMAMIEASTGKRPDIVIGKPNLPFVQEMEHKIGIAAKDIAMIGDRLYTDIAMGHTGITTILVLSGETHIEDLSGSPFQPNFIMGNLSELYHTMLAS
jgi:HAD superfamily hydrolase (TIGR01457 family)